MSIGEFVRREREKRGWSQIDLARESHVSAASISRLENGESLGRFNTVLKITNTLGIEPAVVWEKVYRPEEKRAEPQRSEVASLIESVRDILYRLEGMEKNNGSDTGEPATLGSQKVHSPTNHSRTPMLTRMLVTA